MTIDTSTESVLREANIDEAEGGFAFGLLRALAAERDALAKIVAAAQEWKRALLRATDLDHAHHHDQAKRDDAALAHAEAALLNALPDETVDA